MHRNTTELCCPLYQCGESWLGTWLAVAGRTLHRVPTLGLMGVDREQQSAPSW